MPTIYDIENAEHVPTESAKRVVLSGTSPGASALSAYGQNDIDDSTSTEYYGKSRQDGAWCILKVESTGVTYATVTNNPSVTDYTTAWTGRAALVYGRLDQAF